MKNGKNRTQSKRKSPAPEAAHESFWRPASLPGVHITHIGGRGAVNEIRAYWQARGAVFMHLSFEDGQQEGRLCEVLERSHIVFCTTAGAYSAFGRDLQKYCERAEKPLILLNGDSVRAITEALQDGFPVT